MIKNILLQIMLFLCFLVSHATNDLSKITFEPLLLSEELLSKSIHRIFQDKEGYIWLGTEDRIYRYDGYKLKVYSNNIESSKSLTDNEVWAIAEDKNNIWVGTQQGVKIINKKNYEISDWDYSPLKNVKINYIMRDSKDNIWICAQSGLYKYSSKTSRTTVYKYKYKDDNSLSGNGINYIYEDQDKNIWIAVWESGLCRYIPSRDNFVRYPKLGNRNNPFRIFQDKNKNYWIGTWGDGLFRFYPSAKGLNAYENYDIKNQNGKIKEDIFYSIEQDDKFGYIWLVSYKGVFVIKDVKEKIYTELVSSSFFTGTNNLFNEIMKDRNGNFWIGTYGNVIYTLNFNKPNIITYNLSEFNRNFDITPSVNAIFEDNDGIIWLSLKRMGLLFFDRIRKQFININYNENVIKMFKQEDINLIKGIKSRGEIWITINNNYTIFVFKKEKGEITFLRKIIIDVDVNKYPLSDNNIRSIFEDSRKNIWIGTQAGLYLMDKVGKIKLVKKGLDYITLVTEDKFGDVWIASSKLGISCLKHNNNSLLSYNQKNHRIDNNNIQSLYCQSSGRVWAGSKNGSIYTFDEKANRYIAFENKISIREEPILDISEDKFGNVWISTNKKIIDIDPKTMNSFTYTQFDGLIVNPFNKGSYFKSQLGHVYFGGNKGFCYFPSSEFIKQNNKENKVFITNINLQEKSIFDTPYKNNLNLETGELILEPWQNNFEIDFSSLSYLSKAKIEYAYKIKEIDNSWNYISGERFFVTYNNLLNGNYTFLVKVRNEYGVWSSNSTKLIIHKKPHFYETWWAYVFYILIISAIIYSVFRSGIKRLELKNELRISQIEKETAEQLIQNKLKYFTNISHELMTPLTIISFLIEDVQRSSKTNIWQFQTMKSNINRLKRLLQQILDFKKVESGNMKLKIQWSDIVSFTKDICDNNFSPLIKEKQIHFNFSSTHDKIELYFDADKIDKILYNLMSNAIKYTQTGGEIQVQIQTKTIDDEEYIRIVVNDTGKGISAEELPNIFTRFYNPIKIKSEYSNGIGLSLTKELVEIHHGTITVESQLNAGTIFIIEIPMSENCYSENEFFSKSIAQSKEIIITENKNPIDLIGNKTTKLDTVMLIVEDNPELRFILNKILARDYQTIVSENGKRALEVIAEKEVDIIISDVSMPEMDGLTLCRTLKSNIETSHIPIVLITARNTIEDRVECYNAGADGFLSKPFEQEILEAKIKNLIKSRRSKQLNFQNNVELNISTLAIESIEEIFLNKIIELIKNDYLSDNDFDPSFLADKLNISRSTLYRKIKSLTSLSPSDFIRNIRLKHACELLKDIHIPIKEVAFEIGFVDQRYFSSCFKNEFGITPSEFQKNQNLLESHSS